MRCPVCGRPVRVAGALSEALLPREVECGGCSDEFDALLALKNADGSFKHTPDQAKALARSNHERREVAVLKALQRRRLQNNAAGLAADEGTPLPATMTVSWTEYVDADGSPVPKWAVGAIAVPKQRIHAKADVMAKAQARLAKLDEIDNPATESEAMKVAKARGLR